MSDYLFLLGGQDLEMCEIEKILKEQKQEYVNKKLSWGAKLSAYEEYFDTTKTMVAIELISDTTPSKNFINIDHHNTLSTEKTAIEQVAELLGIALSSYQKLVAVNDVSHIKGMQKSGASKEMIDDIRAKDRACQGVSQKDEHLAQLSVAEMKYLNGVAVICSKTEKFSAVTDRVQEKKLLVYNENKLNYFGENRDVLVRKYAKEINRAEAYYGGDKNGYFGFVEDVFSKEELKEKIKEVIEHV